MACGVHSDDQHFLTASTTASAPRTFRYVSCCPANESPGRSSAFADERTASAGSPSRVAWASRIAAMIASEGECSSNSRRIATDAFSNEMPRSTISGRASSRMHCPRSWSETKARYAAVVTWKPPGTEKPARAMRASERPLPPTTSRPSFSVSRGVVKSAIFSLLLRLHVQLRVHCPEQGVLGIWNRARDADSRP